MCWMWFQNLPSPSKAALLFFRVSKKSKTIRALPGLKNEAIREAPPGFVIIMLHCNILSISSWKEFFSNLSINSTVLSGWFFTRASNSSCTFIMFLWPFFLNIQIFWPFTWGMGSLRSSPLTINFLNFQARFSLAIVENDPGPLPKRTLSKQTSFEKISRSNPISEIFFQFLWHPFTNILTYLQIQQKMAYLGIDMEMCKTVHM